VIHPVITRVVFTWNGKRIVADPTNFPPMRRRRAAFRAPLPRISF